MEFAALRQCASARTLDRSRAVCDRSHTRVQHAFACEQLDLPGGMGRLLPFSSRDRAVDCVLELRRTIIGCRIDCTAIAEQNRALL